MPGPYAFKQIFAADPSNTSNVAKGGSILLFAPGDASKKPLVLTDLANGMVLPNPVPINANGFGPAFLHETLPQVAWEGGGFSGTFESFEGLRADAVAAREASQASAQAAGDARVAAETAAGNAATGAAGALAGAVAEAAAAKTAAQQAAGLVGAPAGAAVLAAIQPGGAAYGALSGTIENQTSALAAAVISPADALPNTAWVGLTEPRVVALGGKVYVGTTGDHNAVYVEEYTQPVKDGPLWLRRHFIAQIPNDVLQDDHNNPAIIVRPGKPLVAIYSGHSLDGVLRWRKSRVNIEQGIDFKPEKQLDLPVDNATAYVNAHVHGNNIWVLHRTGPKADFWSLSKSTDWGDTFTHVGRIISAAAQFYVSGAVAGDVLRITSAGHPTIATNHNLWYAEINLVTGSITKSDGTVLGNLDGTNLPIPQSSMELIATPLAGQVLSEAVVSNSPNPEIVWTAGAVNNIGATGRYWYAVRVGGVWKSSPVRYIGEQGTGASWGAGHFQTTPPAPGTIYLTRKSGSKWEALKVTTADGGETWADNILESSSNTLTQAWPVDKLDGTNLLDVVANNIYTYGGYTSWTGAVRPLPLSQGVKRWEPVGVTTSTIPSREVSKVGLYLPGAAGNYVSTPDTPANSPTQVVRLEVDVALDNWASGGQQALLCKESTNTSRSIWLGINGDGKPLISWSPDGSASLSLIASPALPLLPGERAQIRCDFVPLYNSGTQRRIRFWFRRPGDTAWTMHNITQDPSPTALFDSNSSWEVGSRWLGTTSLAKGTFYSAAVRTIGGTILTQWRGDVANTKQRDTTGAIWTVNGSGSAWTAIP